MAQSIQLYLSIYRITEGNLENSLWMKSDVGEVHKLLHNTNLEEYNNTNLCEVVAKHIIHAGKRWIKKNPTWHDNKW